MLADGKIGPDELALLHVADDPAEVREDRQPRTPGPVVPVKCGQRAAATAAPYP